MSFQGVATAVLVLVAFAYLVWKIGFAGRQRSRRRPDVPAAALVRKARARRPHDKRRGGG